MPQLAYVAGRLVPLRDAHVHVEDRGLQFADALYEVAAVMNGRMLDWDGHLTRLRRGCAALFIEFSMSDAALLAQAQRLVAVNGHRDALLYMQLSRGTARRDHGFPLHARPTLVMTVRRFDFAQRIGQQARGVGVITVNDMRWQRVDLKTTGLLANVLAKQDARAAGAFEGWLVSADGDVREGGSTNAYIVRDGTIITHPLSAHILPGIARATLLRLARDAQITVVERPFTLDEALAADEALLTSTTAPLLPVVTIDGRPVGDGAPGPVAARLAALVWDEIARQTGWKAPR
ncbi:D-amino-acid transaminase [Polymorphobacter fuscus]|uniref:Probable branched-chain-amino-acid aminotransferase n=1 Tax=Sandarakinorhabdus fusca TaxID=1439888 RepID=A0A7C9KX61_9SPHN|nr:D-amino-acid transaminase [Polymorphobacter fuscus]KAB7646357.1 D-amino-acid transaminase [Polymorphobacter fuscus]MQT17585.1 D-amino-acid transaminase [Polymorphobacter fuscus]NJC09872.1 D-alanine transaminase [Polymorphobacter fuscus]